MVKIPQHFWSRAEGEVAQDEQPAEVFRQTGLWASWSLGYLTPFWMAIARGTTLVFHDVQIFFWTWICSCIASKSQSASDFCSTSFADRRSCELRTSFSGLRSWMQPSNPSQTKNRHHFPAGFRSAPLIK